MLLEILENIERKLKKVTGNLHAITLQRQYFELEVLTSRRRN